MAHFYGWGSTASRLELLWGSLLFTTKFPGIPGTVKCGKSYLFTIPGLI